MFKKKLVALSAIMIAGLMNISGKCILQMQVEEKPYFAHGRRS